MFIVRQKEDEDLRLYYEKFTNFLKNMVVLLEKKMICIYKIEYIRGWMKQIGRMQIE